MKPVHFNQRKQLRSLDGIPDWTYPYGFLKEDSNSNQLSIVALHVIEDKTKYSLELTIPGFSRDDVVITIVNKQLCVSGNNSSQEEVNKSDYSRKDFSCKSFEHWLQLPGDVDIDQHINAQYKNGVLNIELKKDKQLTKQQKRSITIQ